MSYVAVTIYQPPGNCEPIVNVYGTSDGTMQAAQALCMRLRRKRGPVVYPGTLKVYRRRVVDAAETADVLAEVMMT